MISRLAKSLWAHFRTDSLFRNSLYLMMSTGILGAFGFIFWLMVSHLYRVEIVGTATTLISAATLLATLSTLGMNNVLIRFLSGTNRKDEHISTAFTSVTLAALLFSLGFVVYERSTHVLGVTHSLGLDALFILFVIATAFNVLLEGCFIAFREARYVLMKNVVASGLKVAFPVLLAGAGVAGIIGSIGLASSVACALAAVLVIRRYTKRIRIGFDASVLSETRRFALGNYAASILVMLPSSVLPLIAASRLGHEAAAFLYMPLMFQTLLNVIPLSSGQSLFAEASNDEVNLRRYVLASAKHLFMLLLPLVAIVMLASPLLLGYFGSNYAAEGASLLRVLAFGSLLGALNYLGDAILNVQKKVGLYIFMNVFNASSILVSTYIVAPRGLLAIGYATIGAQALTMLVYLVVNQALVRDFWLANIAKKFKPAG